MHDSRLHFQINRMHTGLDLLQQAAKLLRTHVQLFGLQTQQFTPTAKLHADSLQPIRRHAKLVQPRPGRQDHVLGIADTLLRIEQLLLRRFDRLDRRPRTSPKLVDVLRGGCSLFRQLTHCDASLSQGKLHPLALFGQRLKLFGVGSDRLLSGFALSVENFHRLGAFACPLSSLVHLLLDHHHLARNERLLLRQSANRLVDALETCVGVHLGCVCFTNRRSQLALHLVQMGGITRGPLKLLLQRSDPRLHVSHLRLDVPPFALSRDQPRPARRRADRHAAVRFDHLPRQRHEPPFRRISPRERQGVLQPIHHDRLAQQVSHQPGVLTVIPNQIHGARHHPGVIRQRLLGDHRRQTIHADRRQASRQRIEEILMRQKRVAATEHDILIEVPDRRLDDLRVNNVRIKHIADQPANVLEHLIVGRGSLLLEDRPNTRPNALHLSFEFVQ